MNIYADAFKSAFASVSRRACLGLEDSSHGESFLEEPKSMKQSSLEKAGEVSKMTGVIGALVTTNSARANAISFFPSDAQKGIDSVAAFQKPVYELLNMLKPSMVPNAVGVYSMQQQLKGGKDDSDVVLLYNINYIIPLQKKMDEVAGKLKLDGGLIVVVDRHVERHLLLHYLHLDRGRLRADRDNDRLRAGRVVDVVVCGARAICTRG